MPIVRSRRSRRPRPPRSRWDAAIDAGDGDWGKCLRMTLFAVGAGLAPAVGLALMYLLLRAMH